MAGPQLAPEHAALRADHSDTAGQGLLRSRLLRPQYAVHRGAHRSRYDNQRRRRQGRALALLRPRPRSVTLRVLRSMPAPDGLRQVRLLPPEGLQPGAVARGESEPAAPEAGDPTDGRGDR